MDSMREAKECMLNWSVQMIGHGIRDLHSFLAAETISFKLAHPEMVFDAEQLGLAAKLLHPRILRCGWLGACMRPEPHWHLGSFQYTFKVERKQVCSYEFDCRACKGVNKTWCFLRLAFFKQKLKNMNSCWPMTSDSCTKCDTSLKLLARHTPSQCLAGSWVILCTEFLVGQKSVKR